MEDTDMGLRYEAVLLGVLEGGRDGAAGVGGESWLSPGRRDEAPCEAAEDGAASLGLPVLLKDGRVLYGEAVRYIDSPSVFCAFSPPRCSRPAASALARLRAPEGTHLIRQNDLEQHLCSLFPNSSACCHRKDLG